MFNSGKPAKTTKIGLRFVATVLVAAMLIQIMPVAAFAQQAFNRLDPAKAVAAALDGEGETAGATHTPMPEAAGIIVRMRESSGEMSAQGVAADGMASGDGAGMGDGMKIVDSSSSLQLVEVGEGQSLEEALDELRSMDSVEWAEPNYILRAQAYGEYDFVVPEDPKYGDQWGLDAIDIEGAWGWALEYLWQNAWEDDGNPYDLIENGILDEEEAGALLSTAESIVVAVIDTGVDATHEDLNGRVLPGYNTISNNQVTADDSVNGHGTHVAGIIAAKTNNTREVTGESGEPSEEYIGIAGTAGEFPVSILPVKALDSAGIGTMYDVAEAIIWAADQHARVINLSLGARLFDYPRTLADAVAYAQNKGALVVAAAGNDSRSVAGFYPACLPGVISVGASTDDDDEAWFSNSGSFMLAPGENILSTLPTRVDESGYGEMTGTSQACAFAGGTAALILSVFPDATQGALVTGLRIGGSYYDDILNAGYALTETRSTDAGPDDSIRFITPIPRPNNWIRVAGEIDLTVRVGDPTIVSRIEFGRMVLGEEGWENEPLAPPLEGSSIKVGGYATLKWNTAEAPDGYQTIAATSYDDDNDVVGRTSIGLDIANGQTTGLIIDVVNPQGIPAAKALVTVHHVFKALPYEGADEEYLIYEELWNAEADVFGRVILPAAVATGGNDYLVTARGTNPAFFYWAVVRAPNTNVRLTAEGASTLDVSAYKTDGSPLTGADVSLELLGAALPGIMQPDEVIDFEEWDNETNLVPLLQLNASGEGSIVLSPGNYNVRITDHADRYYLCSYNVLVNEPSETVSIGSTPHDLNVITLNPDEDCTEAYMELECLSDPCFPMMEPIIEGDSVTVTAGVFGGSVDVTYLEGSDDWIYWFWAESMVEGGGNHPISVGESLSATIEPEYPEQVNYDGRSSEFVITYKDAFGNILDRVRKNGTGVYPQVRVRDSEGTEQHFPIGTSWYGASWAIPDGIPLGQYSLTTFFDGGGFDPVESEPLEIEIISQDNEPPEPPSPFTATFMHDGLPLSGLQVDVAVLDDGSYYTDLDGDQTEQDGKLDWYWLIEDGIVSPGDKIALIAFGIPDGWWTPLFVTRTLTLGEPPMSVTVEVGDLHEINLTAEDRDGEPLYKPLFSVYRYEAGGVPVGLPLLRHTANALDLMVEEGEYLFQASQRQQTWDYVMYYLSKQLTVTSETPEGGLPVTLDPSEAARFSVSVPESDSWRAGAVALYPPGITQVPLFGFSDSPAALYASPGTYRVEGVMTQGNAAYPDGLWCYWLTRESDIVLSSSTPCVWALGNSWNGQNTTFALTPPDKTDFGVDEIVTANVRIEDGNGNRLVGMALNFTHLGLVAPTSLSSIRIPGGGHVLVADSGSSEDEFGAQNHQAIAPSITVLDPEGEEVYRYKDEGTNYWYLMDWDPHTSRYWVDSSRTTMGTLLAGGSTYFGGEYLIPEDAVGGDYQIVMELETGPEGSFTRTIDFNVMAVHAPPRLTALPPFTNAETISVAGVTVPGASATLYSSANSGESVVAGTATADEDGRFTVTVSLTEQGVYQFTATSTVGEATSAHSAPVSVTVDRQPPGPVRDLQAEALDASHVRLTWSAPEQEDPSGIAFYRVRRDGEIVANDISPGESLQWQDSGLEPLTEYTYDVRVVDRAGNEAEPTVVEVTTAAGQDPVPPTPPRNLSAFLSGFRVTLTWESAYDNIGVTGYKVHRWVQGEEPPTVTETVIDDPNATSFSDPDYLDASTTYVYVVVACDAAGNESVLEGEDPNGIPAATAEVTTRALVLSGVSWSAPRVGSGLLDPADTAEGNRPLLRVTAIGDVSRTCTVTVILAGPNVNLIDASEENDGVYEIVLTEDTSDEGVGLGVYRGSVPIPEETSRLVAVTCSLSDNAGHTVSAAARSLPAEFAGSMEVTVASEYGSSSALSGAELKLWSPSLGAGAKLTVNGTGKYVFEDMAPATDYELILTSRNKIVLATETGLVVSGGAVTEAVANAQVPATFWIRLLREDGRVPRNSTVSVTHADGTPLAQGTVQAASGVANLTYSDSSSLRAGTQIVVTVRPGSSSIPEFTGVAGARFVLGPDANTFDVNLPRRSKATLRGRVTAEQDPNSVMPDTSIAAYQVFEGFEKLAGRTKTDSSGQYSLDLYEGPVRLVANHQLGMSKEIRLESPLSAGENRVQDFGLPISKAISLTVNTKRIGESEFAMDLDWRVIVHLHVTATNLGTEANPKSARANTQGIENGLVRIPNAEPGDRILITADGRECNMTQDSVEVTLDENCWARAEVNLIEKGTLVARMRDAGSNVHDGLLRYAELFKVEEQGARFIETLKSDEETVRSKPLEPGTYALVFHWAPLPSVINAGGVWLPPLESLQHLKDYLGDEGIAKENLTFTYDPVVDVGTVRVPLPDSVKPGYFRGVEGNELVPNKYESGPGGVITLRGSYRYPGGTRLWKPKLLFGIPYGAQLVPGSVVVTPTEGIEPRMATRPDAVETSFGDYLSEPVSGTVVYRVKMPDNPDTALCEVRMWAQWGSGGNTTEDITAVTISVPYVSIEAPPLVWDQSRQVEVSGKATPFATVRVYDMNYFLAETRASESGTWKATVVLPDRGRQANHFLRAEVILAPADEGSSPNWPQDAAITVSQVESKAVTLSWPEAQGEVAVVQYVVTGYLTDGSVGVVRSAFPSGTGNVTLRVDDLLPGTAYSFKVEAMNASNNWSLALTSSVTTSPPDETAPSWPGGAQLTASEVKFSSLRLNWPAASDNESVKEYRVSCSPATGTLRTPRTVPADTNTLLVEGLSRGREYAFQVEAIDTSGNAAALSRTLTTLQNDAELPVWPEGEQLEATVLDTDVTLTWPTASDNVQISSYPIYRLSGNNWIRQANGYGNSYTIKRLSPETPYTFRVYAQDSSGNRTSAPLEIAVTTKPLDRTPPQWQPGDEVEVYDKTRSSFRIRIPAPYDESGISHYIIKDNQTGQTYTGSVTYFEELTYDQTYSYTVLAQDTRGNRTPESAGLTFSVTVRPDDMTAPSWPMDATLSAPEVSPNNADVVWSPAIFDIDQTGLPSYLLQARDEDGNVVFGVTVGYGVHTWAVGSLQPGRSYTLSVEAIDQWGNVSTDGPKYAIVTPATDTQAPRWPEGARLEAYGLNKAPEGTYTVLLQWPFAMDFGLHHYEITATDSQGRPAPSSPTATQQTSWHMWGLSRGETYTVQVRAKDLSGNVSAALTTTVVTPGGMSGASVGGLSAASGGSLGAQSNDTARVVSSAAVKVEYDEDAVRIESVTMQQSNGRRVDFEPIGEFVYVLVPSVPFNFDVTFNEPERVSELRILAENGAELGGPLQGPVNPGVVIATTGPLSGSGRTPGKLYASYATTPEPFSVDDLPSFDAEVQRSSLPNYWGNATFPTCSVSYDDEEEISGSAMVRALLADPRIHTDLDYTFTQITDGSNPQPSLSYYMTDRGLTFSAQVALDSSAVRRHMGSQGWADAPKVLVRIAGETWVEGGLNFFDLLSTVSGMHDQQNYEMDLDDLLNGLSPDCPAADLNRYREIIEMERLHSQQRTVAKCAFSLGGMALGIIVPGIGFAVGSFLASQFLERTIDAEQKERFNEIKSDIEMNDFCKPKKREWKKDLIADPTWIIDPAGYVYEVTPENRLEGVTATALQNVGGVWTPWDATWYEQDNPLTTDAEGRYAWDVPEGQWKVSFEKEGYEPTESWVMDVPPPHTNVNIAMVTTEAPSVVSVRADSGAGVDISFSNYMRVDTVTPGTVTVTELNADGSVKTDDVGAPVTVSGAVQADGVVADPRNSAVNLAKTFRFVPDTPLVVGNIYLVRISQLVESYTGLSIAGDYTATVVADIVIPVTGVSLSRESVTLEVGSSTALSALIVPANATDQGVSWSSSNTAVATVSLNGTVQAVAVGMATITVTTDDGGYQDTCTVSVIQRATAYEPEPAPSVPAPTAAIVAEETYAVGSGQATLDVMDGILTLDIPAGAFTPGTKLVVRRLKDEATPADPSLALVASPTYEILIQGSGPSKPVTVRFMYCSLCLKGTDPRKLAVYREDESNPGSYTYVGGTVDPVNHTVTVGLNGFSRYVVLGRDLTFSDVADHWGRNEIEILASRYLVNGVSSTEFQPDRMITRAELAKMLVGTVSHDPNSTMPTTAPSSPTFSDVNPDAWHYSVVESASALGLIKGDGGFFRPDDPVTRQEMAVMLGRALGKSYSVPAGTGETLPFVDASDISDWAADGVAAAWHWGLMHGVGVNVFQPLGNATRAQAAAVILRMLELKGLVSQLVTLKGALSVNEIGGRHFELTSEDGKIYVVLPATEPARAALEEVAEDAASPSGIPVTAIGVLSDGPNVYMRGQILKATRVER